MSEPDRLPPSRRPVLVMLAGGMAKRYGGCKPLAPVGLHGEAVIDFNASDGRSAGFGDVVVVVGPQTGPAIGYHVRRCWPSGIGARLVEQHVPLGTAHAALCARTVVGERPFALINADDIYGTEALAVLADHMVSGTDHVNITYRLADTVVSNEPVTRGTCLIGSDGALESMVERRNVTRLFDGGFASSDGLEPARLDPDTPVSMNLWGLRSNVWPVLESAVRAVHPSVRSDGTLPGDPPSRQEVLLPEVVGSMLAGETVEGHRAQAVRARVAPGRCIGVTHAGDLPAVRSELAQMIGVGARGERLWDSVD